MKSKITIQHLDQTHLNLLKAFSEPRTYNTAQELIYEGQVPHAGYVLLEGEIHIIKRKKVIQKLTPNTLFGVNELMNKLPFKFTIKITPKSKVFILDRSTVIEITKDLGNNQLPEVFKEVSA